jgi:hypothetical protein
MCSARVTDLRRPVRRERGQRGVAAGGSEMGFKEFQGEDLLLISMLI